MTAGPVDIYIAAPGSDINTISPNFADVDFGTETGYTSLRGARYDLIVTPAGNKALIIGPVTVNVVNGGVYTGVARDALGGGAPFGLILLDDF